AAGPIHPGSAAMRTTLQIWLLLRRRTTGASDPQRLTGLLAVVAFAVTTAITGVVIGGRLAFIERSQGARTCADSGTFVMFAAPPTLLLLVPLTTLGGAAARLAVARRDAQLAALRLAGASTGQVGAITILDAALQALAGAVIGVAGTFALIPLVLPITFQ